MCVVRSFEKESFLEKWRILSGFVQLKSVLFNYVYGQKFLRRKTNGSMADAILFFEVSDFLCGCTYSLSRHVCLLSTVVCRMLETEKVYLHV